MAVKSFAASFFLFFLAVTPGWAQQTPHQMAFPLGCLPGQSCWIAGYPDLDPEQGVAKDYACGGGASDGDMFLRLALNDATAIPMNVSVFAAADGVVVDALDGLPDRILSDRSQLPTGTPNCGNGIVIKHALGAETAYCHLRKGSVRVQKGQRVTKGDIIAAAGQSGLAFWPQLGFALRNGGYFVDPVSGATMAEGCGLKPRPPVYMPLEFRNYQPVAIVTMGFSINKVEPGAMALGKAPRYAGIDAQEKTINLWGMILGVRKGDEIEVRIRDPRGRTFHFLKVTAEEDVDRQPINLSRERGYTGWRAGMYRGEISVTRRVQNKPEKVTREVSVEVK